MTIKKITHEDGRNFPDDSRLDSLAMRPGIPRLSDAAPALAPDTTD